MNLLQEGIEQGLVIETPQVKKMKIDGIEKNYKVYKIKLDLLFYNEKNDRIASWVSKDSSKIEESKDDIEKYNNLIEELIIQSNKDAMNKTKENIRIMGQIQPGVVLSDGRIIDGNRRYTCLRRLSRDSENFNYFEAVILNQQLEKSEKVIKLLELQLQHGIEEPQDYNPIDKLVGVYNDIVRKKLFTVDEYARNTNQTERKVKESIQISKLMVEFLEFINAENQFYIARELELDGPLHELNGIMKKIEGEDEQFEWKNIVFSNLLMKPSGDMTKYIRAFKDIQKSEFNKDFIEEQMDIVDDVIEKINDFDETTPETINEIRSNEDIKSSLSDSQEEFTHKIKIRKVKKEPLFHLNKSLEYLDAIDLNILSTMNPSDNTKFKDRLEALDKKMQEIQEVLDV